MSSIADNFLEISFSKEPEYLVSVDNPIETRLLYNEIDTLDAMFKDCESLTSLPSVLFDSVMIGESADQMFDNTSSLLSIDKDLFLNCTSITSTINMFTDSAITTIDSDTFQPFISTLSDASETFYKSNFVSLPANLFNNGTQDIDFGYLAYRSESLTSVSSELFGNLTGISNVINIFGLCDALATYPTGLFDGVCTSTVDMRSIFGGCDIMTGNADDLWNDYPLATSSSAFEHCTSLTNYASIPLAWK